MFTYLLICIQNVFLREQLVVRIEHAAHLETRLLCTLNTLDELQASSMRELQQTQRDNAHLTEKLRAWEAVASQADAEKSDMSSAVLQLVAKVESYNDYSKCLYGLQELLRVPHRPRDMRNAPVHKHTRIATRTAERSRSLASEVATLEDKVRRERRLHKTEPLPRVHRCVQTEPQGSSCTYISPVKLLSNPIPPHTCDNDHDPVPDALNTLDAQTNHLRKRLTDLVVEKESLQYVLRDGLSLRDPRSLLSPRKRDCVEDHESVDIPTDQNTDKFDVTAENGRRGGDDFTIRCSVAICRETVPEL
ncbi:hypothetical protein ACEPAI_3261 [Sanghuangporus weigelae]